MSDNIGSLFDVWLITAVVLVFIHVFGFDPTASITGAAIGWTLGIAISWKLK